MAHSLLVASYYILSEEKPYEGLGGDYSIRHDDPQRVTQRLVRPLGCLR